MDQLIRKSSFDKNRNKIVWHELKNGKKHGLYQKWYGNEISLMEECSYEDGQKSGEEKTYFEFPFEGRIRSKCNYVKGKLDGFHFLYRSDGGCAQREYKEGKEIGEVRYSGPVCHIMDKGSGSLPGVGCILTNYHSTMIMGKRCNR
ncbi:Hypothetical protein HVR_LOCUS407 [uncultured virus]|nr:Hypothetical protein HVR_LOCUS407 [uncultured virus]